MSEPSTPQRIRDRLAGHHLLVTGSTGFLAKAFVEKLLRSVDTIGSIHLLVRGRPDGTTPAQRVTKNVLGSSIYDRLRASLGDRFSQFCDEKIRVVGGDLTKECFGLSRHAYDELAEKITLVINSAATVTFDERLDVAVELNTLGPSRLLQFAKDCGHVPFMHVSTCYVCGIRRGVIDEDFSAPEVARESLARCKNTGEFDLDAIVDSMRGEATARRMRFGSDTEECRKQLIEAGMRMSRAYGWNDTYTFTKWVGEQLLRRDHGDVPMVIFRPAIIEGSYEEPTPGWIDGLRMADPIIVAFGRGKLNEFPARADVPIDLIPVDFVVNGMLAAMPVGSQRKKGVRVYQCGSSGRNPLNVGKLAIGLERAFAKRPMNDDNGRPIFPGRLHLVKRDKFLDRWLQKQRRVGFLRKLCEKFHVTRKLGRRLAATYRKIEQIIYFAKIYSPYTHFDGRFSDDALCAAMEALHTDDKAEFPCDVETIDWDDYIINRHVPGLRSYVLGTGAEPAGRIRVIEDLEKTAPSESTQGLLAFQGSDLFDVFAKSAACCPDKPALQIRRNNRWVRYTYADCLGASGSIMRRFQERGLKRGDRVAICAENCPEWGLVYLAAMRAGFTAVPLDPQLPPGEAWACARYAGAKLMCAGVGKADDLQAARTSEDAELVALREPFIPPPGASRDDLPEPADVNPTSLASILFTSGTTVAPKAVGLTHRNFIANANALLTVQPIGSSDEFLSVLPMYHAFEFTGGFLIPLACGATITSLEQLKGPEIVSAMQATGTTVMLVVPRLLHMFHQAIENQVAAAGRIGRAAFRTLGFLSNVSKHRQGRMLFSKVHKRFGGRLRMFVSGGSRLDPELFDAFARMGFTVCEGYGLTETSPVLTVNPAKRARRNSVGPALPNIELEVRNPNLEGIGEVWARGNSIMSGYVNNPEATSEVLVDGWFKTGDLGRIDSDGYLYITGRSKDLIITGAGKNVYPDEVEVRYRDLPFTKDLCVFGMPSDDGLGDVVHAVVVLDTVSFGESDRSSAEREIRAAVETTGAALPEYQRIAVLHFWERDLPKTSTLKAKRNLIQRTVRAESSAEVRDEAVDSGSYADVALASLPDTIDNPQADKVVRGILARQCRRDEASIKPATHLLLDLGIDSIGRIEVLGEVEARFNMKIDDKMGAKIARMGDLLQAIGARQPSAGGARATPWRQRLAPQKTVAIQNGKPSAALGPIRWLIRSSMSVFFNSYVRVVARGRANIPKTGAFLLAPNHSSHLDSPSVVEALGDVRRVWVAGAEDYFFNTPFKRFLFGKVLDTIPFDRQADGLQGLRRCGDALNRGDGLLIFPEGTRSLTGRLQPFKIGTAVLAVERRVPVIPVHIARAYDLLPKGGRFVRPGKIIVTFCKPIEPPELAENSDHYKAFHDVTKQIEAAVAAVADGTAS